MKKPTFKIHFGNIKTYLLNAKYDLADLRQSLNHSTPFRRDYRYMFDRPEVDADLQAISAKIDETLAMLKDSENRAQQRYHS